MPRAPKKCGRPACANTITGRTYCRDCEAERQQLMAQRRGTTTQRGYGAKHQSLRAQWEPKVATGSVTCWRCGDLITTTDEWDLGHDDRDRSITRGPEHARRCNRSTAGASNPPPTRSA